MAVTVEIDNIYILSRRTRGRLRSLACAAYEGEGTHESVGVEAQREKELAHQEPSGR